MVSVVGRDDDRVAPGLVELSDVGQHSVERIEVVALLIQVGNRREEDDEFIYMNLRGKSKCYNGVGRDSWIAYGQCNLHNQS